MKTRFVAMILFSIGIHIPAQTIISGANQVGATNVQNSPFTVIQRDANSTVWQRTNYERGPSGEMLPHVHHLVELATGLNYTNSQTGQWTPSKEEIELLSDGTAAATQGQHRVSFPSDIYSGVIHVITADGRHLKSRPVGISYDDGSNTVLIAQLKDSVGEIVGSNEVVYPDAFTGLKADLRYTYTHAGFEQEVILREQPPTPGSFGLSKARMQLLTEFFDTATPLQKMTQVDSNGLTDMELTFGTMRMQRGKAFSIGSHPASGDQIPVCKSWLNVNGRTLLVEQLMFESIRAQLQQLPTAVATTMRSAAESVLCKVSESRLLPLARLAQRNEPKTKQSNIVRIAEADSRQGVVLDYVAVDGSYDAYTFSSGTTYFISGPVLCGSVTLEGGAVLKYPNDTTAYLEADSSASFTCNTGPYNPAIFTAGDDDTVGESVSGTWSGYTGSIQPGGYANPAIRFGVDRLHDVRICYAKQAVAAFFGAGFTIADSQIINCTHGLSLAWQGGVANAINCLFASPVSDAIRGGGSGSVFHLYFCTVDNCSQLAGMGDDGTVPETVYSVNSIFSSIGDFGYGTKSGGYNGFCDTSASTFGDNPIATDDRTAVYDTADGMWYGYYYAQYYLYGGSPFSQVGTTDPAYVLDPTVLTDIGKKVTSFPQVFDSDEDVTLGPALSGDASATPDLGYHYDRIDYIYGDYYGPSYLSHHVTFAPGTAIAWGTSFGGGEGIMLELGGRMTFHGTEQSPCYFVRGNTVWEQDTGGDGTGIDSASFSAAPVVDASFTRFSTVDNFGALGSAAGSLSFSATNCEFYNASFGAYIGLAANLFNCLLIDNNLSLGPPPGYPACSLVLANCTEVNGSINVFRYSSGPAINVDVTNCAFDGTAITVSANDDSSVSCNHNAYLSGATTLPNDSVDVPVAAFNWQTGPLGNYYLPDDPPAHDGTLLVDAGSQSGQAAQLFHYTTQTNQTIEADSPVDIGYHYVALGPDGNPPTTGVQGIPDYQLDSVLPQVSITAPVNNSSFGTTRVNVTGTFTDAYLKRITVNGIVAFATGNTFEALNVPLAAGANTVTATIEDLVGKTGTASITVNGSATPVDPVQLTATPVAGFAPLSVTFQITANAPGTLQQVIYDFEGDGSVGATANDLGPITHVYTAGEHFPVVTLVTSAGRFSSSGGWNSIDPNRLTINVQATPTVLNTISVTDPVDVKCDSAGDLYVLSRSTATILEYDSSGALLRSLPSIGTTPTGLDVDASGNVYVAVSGDNQVLKFNPTTSSFQLDTTFGTSGRIGKIDKTFGSGNGEFNSPHDVAVTPDGMQIAVSDSGNNRIQLFTISGSFTSSYGQFGTGSGQFNVPKGLAFDSLGDLYIVDSGNNRIALVLSQGTGFGASGTTGAGLGQFNGPINLGIGVWATYVADTGNNRIQQFDPVSAGHLDPASLNPHGTLSTETGLSQPEAVAAVTDNLEEKIYIADTGNNRVILVKLPHDDPAATWNAMVQQATLVNPNISAAMTYFSSLSADKYRSAFLSEDLSDLAADMSQIGTISPVVIGPDDAQYRFDQVIDGTTITFPIEFIKENGVWKIDEF
jgi:hypothetical protein